MPMIVLRGKIYLAISYFPDILSRIFLDSQARVQNGADLKF